MMLNQCLNAYLDELIFLEHHCLREVLTYDVTGVLWSYVTVG